MKNSLFKRLFLTYGITIIIGFGVLAVLLLQMFNQYFIDSKKQVMIEQGQKINQEIVIGLYTGQIDSQRLTDDLQVLDKLLDARIWLVDGQGSIIGVSGVNEEKYLGQQIGSEELQKLAIGKTYFETGNFGGKLEAKALTAAYPIFIGGSFKGGLYIHAPLTEVEKSFKGIYTITLGAILLSMLLAYVILYFQVRKIAGPLAEISAAAREIAGGEFQKRLSIKTSDEIEDLSNSFNHMAESLEKIEENRRNLIANISHDIRSPITSISGFAEGILDGTIPPEKHREYLEKVRSESKRLIKITNNLLELSKMQQGELQPIKENFELHEMIRRSILSFERQITSKSLSVTLHFFDEAAVVYSDAGFIERILLNLIENAVKFTPDNRAISIRTTEKAGKIIVEILNEGVTIDEVQLAKIWERFHKGDVSRGEHKSGFGLGLAIVRQMIQLLDERIEAESREDQVKFTLSIQKAKS
jgi:signal transduction histidine kinase